MDYKVSHQKAGDSTRSWIFKAIFLYKNIFIAINNQGCGIVIIGDDYSHFYICQ
jgi:hypothetical protein